MGDKLNTVHIETGMGWLGGSLQAVQLMNGLIQRGHQARLICRKGSPIQRKVEEAGLPVHPISFPIDFDGTVTWRIKRLLQELKPDVVHIHSRRGADLWGGVAARSYGAKAVILSRRVDYPISREPLSFLKFGCLCDKIIAVSNGVTDVLVAGGLNPNKIACAKDCVEAGIYDGVQSGMLRRELGISADVPLVGMVGRLIGRKGHRYLIDSIAAISKCFPDTRYVIAGSGILLGKLEKHAKAVGAEDKVHFLGFRHDIPRILCDLDVLVHPATREGLGVAILQAMASRTPVVATPVGGIPEAVRDGEDGFIVPPRDSNALGKAIMRLLENPELRKEMGENGRRIAEDEFSVDRMVEDTLKVYREVLESKYANRRK